MAKAATEALTTNDRGVEVGSSWGAATIPAEAGDPSAALQLADVRMYAQKESRRTALTRPDLNVTDPPSTEPTIRATRG